jgi:hypothetical protein
MNTWYRVDTAIHPKRQLRGSDYVTIKGGTGSVGARETIIAQQLQTSPADARALSRLRVNRTSGW